MSKITDTIKDKHKKNISTEEALKNVKPFFTEDELNDIIKNNEKIVIK